MTWLNIFLNFCFDTFFILTVKYVCTMLSTVFKFENNDVF